MHNQGKAIFKTEGNFIAFLLDLVPSPPQCSIILVLSKCCDLDPSLNGMDRKRPYL